MFIFSLPPRLCHRDPSLSVLAFSEAAPTDPPLTSKLGFGRVDHVQIDGFSSPETLFNYDAGKAAATKMTRMRGFSDSSPG
jgi:hypothetical protein